MKSAFKVFLLIAVAATIPFVGCSDKSTNTVDNETIAASLQTETTTLINNMGYFIDDGIDFANYGVGSVAKPADTTYFDYDSETYWWTLYRQMDYGDPVVWTIEELDSVRFLDGETYQDEPDDSTDGLQFRITGEEVMSYATDSTMTLDYTFGCDYASLQDDTVNVDGAMTYYLEVVLGNFEYGYQFDCEYDDVDFYSDPYSYDDHPTSGTMTVTVYIYSTGDAAQSIPSGNYHATMNLTFTEDGYDGAMTVEGENFTWAATWDDVQNSPVYGGH